MVKEFLYVGAPGINDLVKQFPEKEDRIRFPNLSVGNVGSLLQDYFSFEGFYEIKRSEEDYLVLRKVKDCSKGNILPKVNSNVNLEFSHILELQKFANSGVSVVKGKISSNNIEGTISKLEGREYQLKITKKELFHNIK